MNPRNEPPGFLDFGWQSWLVLAGFVVVVVLFLGPGMWSSSTEPLWTTLWRSLRAVFDKQPQPALPPDSTKESAKKGSPEPPDV